MLLDNGGSGDQDGRNPARATADGIGDDEKVTAFPAVAGDIVFFTTTTYSPATPCTPFSANLYAFTFIGGAGLRHQQRRTTEHGLVRFDGGKSKGGGRPRRQHQGGTMPASARRRRSSSTSTWCSAAGSNVEMFGDPQDFNNGVGQAGVRILSWRNIQQ